MGYIPPPPPPMDYPVLSAVWSVPSEPKSVDFLEMTCGYCKSFKFVKKDEIHKEGTLNCQSCGAPYPRQQYDTVRSSYSSYGLVDNVRDGYLS